MYILLKVRNQSFNCANKCFHRQSVNDTIQVKNWRTFRGPHTGKEDAEKVGWAGGGGGEEVGLEGEVSCNKSFFYSKRKRNTSSENTNKIITKIVIIVDDLAILL